MNEEALKEKLDNSLAGQVLATWPEDKQMVVEKDVGIVSLAIGNDGQTIIRSDVNANIFAVPEFQLSAKGNTEEEAIDNLIISEERLLIKLLLVSSYSHNKLTIINMENPKGGMETVQFEVEKNRIIVDKFILNRTGIGGLKKNMNAIEFDPIGAPETNKLPTIWGIGVYMSHKIFDGMILAVAGGRFLGIRKVKECGTINNYNEPVVAYSRMAMCILNPRAVSLGAESRWLNISISLIDKVTELFNKGEQS